MFLNMAHEKRYNFHSTDLRLRKPFRTYDMNTIHMKIVKRKTSQNQSSTISLTNNGTIANRQERFTIIQYFSTTISLIPSTTFDQNIESK